MAFYIVMHHPIKRGVRIINEAPFATVEAAQARADEVNRFETPGRVWRVATPEDLRDSELEDTHGIR